MSITSITWYGGASIAKAPKKRGAFSSLRKSEALFMHFRCGLVQPSRYPHLATCTQTVECVDGGLIALGHLGGVAENG